MFVVGCAGLGRRPDAFAITGIGSGSTYLASALVPSSGSEGFAGALIAPELMVCPACPSAYAPRAAAAAVIMLRCWTKRRRVVFMNSFKSRFGRFLKRCACSSLKGEDCGQMNLPRAFRQGRACNAAISSHVGFNKNMKSRSFMLRGTRHRVAVVFVTRTGSSPCCSA